MPGPPDYDGVCLNCMCDEYVCQCPDPRLVSSAVAYSQPPEEGHFPDEPWLKDGDEFRYARHAYDGGAYDE